MKGSIRQIQDNEAQYRGGIGLSASAFSTELFCGALPTHSCTAPSDQNTGNKMEVRLNELGSKQIASAIACRGTSGIKLACRCFEPSQPENSYQGIKQTSVCLQVIHSTSQYTASFFFSNHNSNYIHNFGTQTQRNNHTCFGANLHSASTQHGNLRELCVTMSRVT